MACPARLQSVSHFIPSRPLVLFVGCQSLETLRSQLEAIQGDLDKATLSEYVHRLSRLWADAQIDPQHSAQSQLQRSMHAANTTSDTTPVSLPPLPILSSSSLHPSHPVLSTSAIPASVSSAHPLADASHITAQHTRPARPTTAQLRSQLFEQSKLTPPDSDTAATPHPDDPERGARARSGGAE